MTGNYIKINKLKGIKELDFEIPKPGVYVLTASNGSGKTTLMVCLERLKKTNAFSNRFTQQGSPNVDSYRDSKITYTSKNGNSVTYTYRKKSDSWRPIQRDVTAIREFGYGDVVAIPTLGKRVYTQSQKIRGGSVKAASSQLRESMAEVLENPKFLKLLKINLGEVRGRGGSNRRNNTAFLLSSGTMKFGTRRVTAYYSEISFSLGEIFTLNLLFELEVIEPNSLLVIDELEVALHPRVQINLLRYIEKKAKEKKLTVLISTHSSSLIKCTNNLIFLDRESDGNIKIHYNCYPTLALQEVAVEEDMQPDYVFFVEDTAAELLLREMLKHYFNATEKRQPVWKILPVGGYSEVVRFTRKVDRYLLNRRIGQYAFLDKDVEDVKRDLLNKRSRRTAAENELLEQFQAHEDRIKFLEITPELGIWEWISSSYDAFQGLFKEMFPDISINGRDLLNECNSAFPTSCNNPRENAKNRINWIVKQLENITNEDCKRIKQSLVIVYAENIYSDTEKINKLKSIFGPIFNKKGNGS